MGLFGKGKRKDAKQSTSGEPTLNRGGSADGNGSTSGSGSSLPKAAALPHAAEGSGPPPQMWGNRKPAAASADEGGPPPPMWGNKKPAAMDSDSGGGPPPPMWGNKKPGGGGGGGGDGPPPPMWGNKKPGGGGGDGPPPPMWGNSGRASDANMSFCGESRPGSTKSNDEGGPSGDGMIVPGRQLTRKEKVEGEEKPKKYIKQYEISKALGKGAYAKVKLCIDTDTGQTYAIKIFKKSLLKRKQSRFKGTAFDDVLREIAIMRKLDHPNVVNMHDVIDDVFANKLYMVMDFCKHGAIMDSHEMPCQPLKMSDCRRWFADSTVGLLYLHFQGVAHFDLKPDNILIGPTSNAVIADFGVSRIMNEGGGGVSGSPGTPTYTAPEAYGDVKYDPFLADVWSFGVTLHAMIFGSLPFMSLNQIELIEMITAPKEWVCKLRRADAKQVSEGSALREDAEMMDLMHLMMRKDIRYRATLEQVKEHPWVKGELASRPAQPESTFHKIEINEEELRKSVVAGHVANFRKTPHGTLLKTTAAAEARAYKAFAAAKSPVSRFLPALKDVKDSTRKRVIIEMADLTHGVEGACLMDCKMGVRTFTEDDNASSDMRADLLAKMLKVDPDAATPEEIDAGGITKMRYLRFREGASTTTTLGWRVDAIQLAEGVDGVVPDSNDLKSIDTEDKVRTAVKQYVQYNPQLCKNFAPKLRELREALERCDVFMSHSFVRTSMLFIYSNTTLDCSVHMIDMSKVAKARVPRLAHRGEWQPGNDEDGYLDGLDCMIRIFEELSDAPMEPPPARGKSAAEPIAEPPPAE